MHPSLPLAESVATAACNALIVSHALSAAAVEGLVACKTPNEWLFNSVSPLLSLVFPDLSYHGHLFHNNSHNEAFSK